MQKKGQNGRNNQIRSLTYQRIQPQNPYKEIKGESIEKIHADINRPRLDIFSTDIAMAPKHIIPHGKKRHINRNEILRNQRRIIIHTCQFIQCGKNTVRQHGIKSADQQKTNFLINLKPDIFNFFIQFPNQFDISFKIFLLRTVSSSTVRYGDKILLSKTSERYSLSTSGIPG